MERVIPILPADDLSAAKRFYVDGLGFDVVWEATEDGANGLLGLRRGDLYLTIDAPMSGRGRDACFSVHDPAGNTIFVIGPIASER